MDKNKLEDLLSIEPYSKLNERLFTEYGFIFRKRIEELKNRVNTLLDEDEGCMTEIN